MKKKAVQLSIKRFFDVFVSLIAVVLCAPLFLVAALMIKLTSPGPILFIQERPGYKKKLFRIYKFRTMKLGSDRMIKGKEVTKDDERITPAGRFLRRSKIDELPQLINVLKGEMSLVGPRPERTASLADYDNKIMKRLDMLPGMTGLAQVCGNIYLPLSDRYKLDIYYVEHFSLWLDIMILIKTFGVVFRGEEKYVRKKSTDSCNNSKN